ncbi:uncharacterized protein LOC116342255 [Contarinia nasturtii]|uniref:uncharacterized protein LOC116342255 n=1 Tax=Contarinia nasturtii TaxID=265458 RepID=UPI0012D4C3FF|nr:uncharacterized protein LOC116342255 [Contarinia nasturtii]
MPALGESKAIALRRFYQLERRLQAKDDIREKYIEAMREEISNGYIERAWGKPSTASYYIPHHYVEKRFRIVHDGSCRTSNSLSLNDIQMKGPKLQFDLADQIMRFRRHQYAVIADIKKMFKQIKVDPSQWDLQRIFWRESPNEPLLEYWMTSVVFGLKSSVHCSCRAMIQCARDNALSYPEAAKAIENNFYMDDGLIGHETTKGLEVLCQEINLIMKSGGFDLRKWHSNSIEVEGLMQSSQSRDEVVLEDKEKEATKVLGLKWIKSTDELAIRVNVTAGQKSKADTKHTWKLQAIPWDEPLPEGIAKKWTAFYAKLHALAEFRIPRWLSIKGDTLREIHGFCDACIIAYGAVIYVRTINADGQIKCILLTSKSKIAPIKPVSIPRLELQGAVMLSRMLNHTLKICDFKDVPLYAWTDSTIVLYWLRQSPEIWAHVVSQDNPADLISRGIKADEIIKSKFWKQGPEWLLKAKEEWPTPKLK